MQVPKAPKKPVKPQAPEQEITSTVIAFLGDHEGPLEDVLVKYFDQVPRDKIMIVCEKDESFYGGEYEYRMGLQYSWRQADPKYDEKMTKYHKKLEEYKEARSQYKLDVEEYKQKLKLWHEEQLKDLTDS